MISRKDKLSLPARRASKLSIWGGGRGDIVKCHAMETRDGEIREIKPVTSDELELCATAFFFRENNTIGHNCQWKRKKKSQEGSDHDSFPKCYRRF